MMIEIERVTDITQYIDGLKAIIFDLDDTLYGEKQYVRSGYNAIAKILPQVEHAADKLWDAFEKKLPAIDIVLKQEGIYSEQLKEQCLSVYRNQKPEIQLYDGVSQMLVDLQMRGYQLGIITDGRPEGQWAKIKALQLEKYIKQIIVTDELGGIEYRKPNEQAFKLMQQKMKIPFEQMCYVGDNIEKDFIAPKKLGMHPIWVKNVEGLYYQK